MQIFLLKSIKGLIHLNGGITPTKLTVLSYYKDGDIFGKRIQMRLSGKRCLNFQISNKKM